MDKKTAIIIILSFVALVAIGASVWYGWLYYKEPASDECETSLTSGARTRLAEDIIDGTITKIENNLIYIKTQGEDLSFNLNSHTVYKSIFRAKASISGLEFRKEDLIDLSDLRTNDQVSIIKQNQDALEVKRLDFRVLSESPILVKGVITKVETDYIKIKLAETGQSQRIEIDSKTILASAFKEADFADKESNTLEEKAIELNDLQINDEVLIDKGEAGSNLAWEICRLEKGEVNMAGCTALLEKGNDYLQLSCDSNLLTFIVDQNTAFHELTYENGQLIKQEVISLSDVENRDFSIISRDYGETRLALDIRQMAE